MRYNKIVFFDDVKDEDKIIWKANKQYWIIGENETSYICECENFTRNVESYGIEKDIKDMYYLI